MNAKSVRKMDIQKLSSKINEIEDLCNKVDSYTEISFLTFILSMNSYLKELRHLYYCDLATHEPKSGEILIVDPQSRHMIKVSPSRIILHFANPTLPDTSSVCLNNARIQSEAAINMLSKICAQLGD